MKTLYIATLLLLTTAAGAQTPHKAIRNGNSAYKEQNYTGAEEQYRKALAKDEKSDKARYNLGNAIYKQAEEGGAEKKNRFEEAAAQYNRVGGQAKNRQEQADAYYNAGNAWLKASDKEQPDMEALNKSIEAYKAALKRNPADADAKHNLAIALKKKKQNEKKDQDKDKQDKDKDKQPPNPKEDPKDPKEDKAPPPPKQQKLSEDDARRILDQSAEEERKAQEKLNKLKGVKSVQKDW